MKQQITSLEQLRNLPVENNEKDGGNFVSGFVIGGLMAAASVFLFSTKKGERTMERLQMLWKRFQHDAGGEVGHIGQELKQSQRPLLQSLGEIMGHVADDLGKEKKRKRKI